MEGEFLIGETFGMQKGVGGGNFLILAADADAALAAAEAAVAAMTNRPGVILPFPGGVVRSGGKVGSRRCKSVVGTTNDAFAPTLRGGRVATLGDFFQVRGERASDVRIEGDLTQVEALGARMAGGALTIEGSVGRDLGLGLAGGRIDVRGAAGDNAGGAGPGAARGMTGGGIVIPGNARAGTGTAVRPGPRVVTTVAGGERVLDGGVETPGGYGAGLAVAELWMGGLGHGDYVPVVVGPAAWPGVRVWTGHPAVSCMASQYAGWAIQVGQYFAMGSGPLRSHARVEQELFGKLRYAETARRGVLVLETRAAPTAEGAAWGGEQARLAPPALTVAVAPTARVAAGGH